LHNAILDGNKWLITLLLEYGAKSDTTDDRGLTAVSTANNLNRHTIVNMLLDTGVKTTPLHVMIFNFINFRILFIKPFYMLEIHTASKNSLLGLIAVCNNMGWMPFNKLHLPMVYFSSYPDLVYLSFVQDSCHVESQTQAPTPWEIWGEC